MTAVTLREFCLGENFVWKMSNKQKKSMREKPKSKTIDKELKTWNDVVQACKDIGFEKITIINRRNYQPVGYSSNNDIATAWMDGGKQVNENQEILDLACDKKSVKSTKIVSGFPANEMRFYGRVHRILAMKTTLCQYKDEYGIIAKYWCLSFQNEKNKLESFPKFIIEIIDKYAIYEFDVKCLVGAGDYGDYLLAKTFKKIWFLASFPTKIEHLGEDTAFQNYRGALESVYTNIWRNTEALKDELDEE